MTLTFLYKGYEWLEKYDITVDTVTKVCTYVIDLLYILVTSMNS